MFSEYELIGISKILQHKNIKLIVCENLQSTAKELFQDLIVEIAFNKNIWTKVKIKEI